MNSLKIKTSLLICIFAIAIFTSCKKDDNVPDIDESKQITESKIWIISFFEDDGKDETYHFTGYEFSFNNDGTATATKNSTTVNGTWNIRESSSKQKKFDLDFGSDDPWDELEDDWDILSLSDAEIKLKDVSGGNGGTDYLTFKKK